MQFSKDFDAELVAYFYAIVHLITNVDRTLTWMINGRVVFTKWKDFMDLLGYDDKGLEDPVWLRSHKETATTHKSKLWPYCTVNISPTTSKKSYDFVPF
ncbi:hypothetical protein D1007_21562 [Hordeum vulgare]|nr:hypothetical protein D1007_21562 [Hordeum vulgare]